MTSRTPRLRLQTCPPQIPLLWVVALACAVAACGPPTPDQRLDERQTDESDDAPDDGAHPETDETSHGHDTSSMAMGEDPDLRPLDAPLELVHIDEVPPREIEDVAPSGPALVFTSAMKGYIEPCGCTLDVLLGGIDRVSAWVRTMGEMNPAVTIDAGSLLFEETALDESKIPQAMRKAHLLLKGHRAMGTRSTTPGAYDLTLGGETYASMLAEADIPVTVANLYLRTEDGERGPRIGSASRTLTLEHSDGALNIGVAGFVDPATVEHVEDVVATDAHEAARQALEALSDTDVRVAVVQGDEPFTRALAEAVPGFDFAIVGYEPRKTDEVIEVGDTAVVQAYSQGRHVGLLKLYPDDDPVPGEWENARIGSAEELERLERRIRYIDQALDRLPPARGREETEFVRARRAELDALKAKHLVASSKAVDIPDSSASYAFFSVAMEPGYPLDVALYERRQAYTAALESLYAELALEIPAAEEGEPVFVGGEACVDCHEDPHDVWMSTPHMLGFKTLVDKGKQFDPDCVKCHVTGYGEPGGSIVGKVEGLEGVQCESCHGPGSIHVESPSADVPGQVHLEVPAEICVDCHDPENSPRFNYDQYVPLILGEGHERRSAEGQ